jgi:hypothetical protein
MQRNYVYNFVSFQKRKVTETTFSQKKKVVEGCELSWPLVLKPSGGSLFSHRGNRAWFGSGDLVPNSDIKEDGTPWQVFLLARPPRSSERISIEHHSLRIAVYSRKEYSCSIQWWTPRSAGLDPSMFLVWSVELWTTCQMLLLDFFFGRVSRCTRAAETRLTTAHLQLVELNLAMGPRSPIPDGNFLH